LKWLFQTGIAYYFIGRIVRIGRRDVTDWFVSIHIKLLLSITPPTQLERNVGLRWIPRRCIESADAADSVITNKPDRSKQVRISDNILRSLPVALYARVFFQKCLCTNVVLRSTICHTNDIHSRYDQLACRACTFKDVWISLWFRFRYRTRSFGFGYVTKHRTFGYGRKQAPTDVNMVWPTGVFSAVSIQLTFRC